jgi:acetylornithine deacetylase/succinyl-diaminopimelate desuccinylase-like protein
MSSITINVSSSSGGAGAASDTAHSVSVVPDVVKAEARRRLEAAQAAERAEAEAAVALERRATDGIQAQIMEEQIRMRVQEEMIRREAERAIVEAAARKAAAEREAAISAEMERLRSRTKVEILEDTVNDLTAQLTALRVELACRR